MKSGSGELGKLDGSKIPMTEPHSVPLLTESYPPAGSVKGHLYETAGTIKYKSFESRPMLVSRATARQRVAEAEAIVIKALAPTKS